MEHTFAYGGDTALVRTGSGLLRGYMRDGLYIFKGVPYAAARRFHPPEPVPAWEGVREATSYGFVCPLLTNDRPGGELYVPHRYWPMDEDCLNLNLWTPGLEGRRPVMVWLHGGGFSAGSAIEQLAYDGASMALHGDAVVVSVNHRLNILGYFDLSDFGEEYENSGNAGTDDLIAALRWVRDNIAAFGGDPDNVTVFGQSGGGAKVTALLQSPGADGLFHRGINMSGVIGMTLADQSLSGRDLTEALMTRLGLHTVRELETVDYRLLARAYNEAAPDLRARGKYTGCMPHPNAHYLGDPCRVGFRPESAHVPMMVGSVFGEFFTFAPAPCDRDAMTQAQMEEHIASLAGRDGAGELIPLFRAAYPERKIIDLERLDFIFRTPEIDYIEKRSALNPRTFSYLFNLDQPLAGGTPPWHCSDIPYVFRNLDLVEHAHRPDGKNAAAYALQETIFNAVMAFARTGDPSTPSLPWKSCEPGHERTMVLGETCAVRENHDHALIPAVLHYLAPAAARRMEKTEIQH